MSSPEPPTQPRALGRARRRVPGPAPRDARPARAALGHVADPGARAARSSATSPAWTCSSTAAARPSGRSCSRGSGARPVGMDNSARQLEHARRLLGEAGVDFPLVHASAGEAPFADASFDVVFCDHGAMTFPDPDITVPEVARLLRPGGLLAFSHTTPLSQLCWRPRTETSSTPSCTGPTSGCGRIEWEDEPDEPVAFTRTQGGWIRLFRAHGLTVERLHEVQPPEGAVSTYRDEAQTEWARQLADGADLGGAEVELSEHAARNRAEWNVWAAEYVEPGRRHWADDTITWGITSVPETEARVLPELEGVRRPRGRLRHRLRVRPARAPRRPRDRHRRLRGAARDRAPLPAGVRARVPARPRQRRGAPVRRRVVRPRRLRVRREHLGRPVRLDPRGRARPAPGRAHRPARERDAARPLHARARGRPARRHPLPAAVLRHAPLRVAGRRLGRLPPRLRRLDRALPLERLRGRGPGGAAGRPRGAAEPAQPVHAGAGRRSGRPRRSGAHASADGQVPGTATVLRTIAGTTLAGTVESNERDRDPPARRPRRDVRLLVVPARAGGRDRRAAGRAVGAGGVPDRRREVPLLPAAGAAARRRHRRRLAADRADEGPDRLPGRRGAWRRRASIPASGRTSSRDVTARLARGDAEAALRRPGAVQQRALPRAARAAPDLALRRGRGALHLGVGSQLPARLPEARREGAGARRGARARPDRDGDAGRGGRHPPGSASTSGTRSSPASTART